MKSQNLKSLHERINKSALNGHERAEDGAEEGSPECHLVQDKSGGDHRAIERTLGWTTMRDELGSQVLGAY